MALENNFCGIKIPRKRISVELFSLKIEDVLKLIRMGTLRRGQIVIGGVLSIQIFHIGSMSLSQAIGQFLASKSLLKHRLFRG
jgi:hypothetical protein